MAITYPRPVGPTDRYVLYKISTGEILNNNATYPRADGGQLVGADPDLVYLYKREPFAPPNYDSRHRSLVVTETPDIPNGNWDITYTTQLRPDTERAQAAQNEESFQFNQHFPVEKVSLHTALVLGILLEFVIDGQAIPAKFQTFVTNYKNRVKNKIVPNYDRLQAILTEIAAGNEPDLDSGWAP